MLGKRAFFLLLMPAASAAQSAATLQRQARTTSADSSAIARLERRIEDAVVRRDAEFLDAVYAPSFRFKHSTGDLETRADRLARLRRPEPDDTPGRTIARDVDSLEVEVHGDVALTTGRIHVVSDGGEVARRITQSDTSVSTPERHPPAAGCS